MTHSAMQKTFGHHFTDLLACPQKAWLHYHGDTKLKVPPPPYLRALQQEGLDIERQVYAERYPNAIQISASWKTRLQETRTAMQAGHPAILQGYVEMDEGAGIIDVLELVGPNPDSDTQHDYRIGEIKRSSTLKTAHVLQATWYTDLLARSTQQKPQDAFFILGSGSREVVRLIDYWDAFERTKTELFAIRDSQTPPGPHLNIACPSCDWRGICLPQLVSEKHLSLLPGLSRKHVQYLQEQGISTWQEFQVVKDDLLESQGFSTYEIERFRNAYVKLSAGLYPLKQELRSDIFSGGLVVAIEFDEISSRDRSGGRLLTPRVIHYEQYSGRTASIVVREIAPDTHEANIHPILSSSKLLFYGLTDLAAFRQIANQNVDALPASLMDVLDILEKFIHAPFLGLTLDMVISETQQIPIQQFRGPARVGAIRKVVDWMEQLL